MEGRGCGGGRKGSAGKIMSLQEFVSSMAPLIDLEKAAEISSESEASSKRMERRGSVMPNLKCTDAQTGLMGKTLLEFQPNKGDVLPPHKEMDIPIMSCLKILMVVPPVYCEVCNVQCGTPDVLSDRKTGLRHWKNLKKLHGRAAASEIPVGTRKQMEVKRRRLLQNGAPKSEVKFCEACSSFVNGQTDYKHHIAKKSHMANVQDWLLEHKKRRVIEAGADPSGVKICYACNTLVNSQITYERHIAGKSHQATMTKSTGDQGMYTSIFPSLQMHAF